MLEQCFAIQQNATVFPHPVGAVSKMLGLSDEKSLERAVSITACWSTLRDSIQAYRYPNNCSGFNFIILASLFHRLSDLRTGWPCKALLKADGLTPIISASSYCLYLEISTVMNVASERYALSSILTIA